MTETFGRSSFLHVDSQKILNKAIKNAINSGDSFGISIPEQTGGFYLFQSQIAISIITPLVIDNIEQYDDCMVVLLTEKQNVYVAIKTSGLLTGEYLFSLSDDGSVDVKQLMSHLYSLRKEISQFNYVTNVSVTSGKQSIIFNSLLELPGDVERVIKVDWFDSFSPVELSDLKKYASKSINLKFVLSGITLLLAIPAFMFLQGGETKAAVEKDVVPFDATAPYQGLIDHLTKTGVSPFHIYRQVAKRLNQIESLSGWDALSVDVSIEGVLEITLLSSHGSMNQLMSFARQNNYQIDVSDQKGYLSAQLDIYPVLSNAARFHVGSYERLLTLNLNAWWDKTSVKVVKDIKYKNVPYQIEKININMPDVVSYDLASLGSLLYGHPYSFDTISMKRDEQLSPNWDVSLSLLLAGVTHNE